MSRPIALLVEDRSEIVMIWSRHLEPLDMDIKVASTLQEALALSHEIPPPDLIILDLRLGDSSDKQTIEAIRLLKEPNPNVVVMVISGFLTPGLAELAIEKGAHSVREKLSFKRQDDLWKEIEAASKRAPEGAHHKLAFVGELIRKLTSAAKQAL